MDSANNSIILKKIHRKITSTTLVVPFVSSPTDEYEFIPIYINILDGIINVCQKKSIDWLF